MTPCGWERVGCVEIFSLSVFRLLKTSLVSQFYCLLNPPSNLFLAIGVEGSVSDFIQEFLRLQSCKMVSLVLPPCSCTLAGGRRVTLNFWVRKEPFPPGALAAVECVLSEVFPSRLLVSQSFGYSEQVFGSPLHSAYRNAIDFQI